MAVFSPYFTSTIHRIYISFSGGKDSTVLLHLVRSVVPSAVAAFVDTGLEYPEIRQFVKTIDNVVWLKPEKNFKKIIQDYGYPLISKEVSQKIYEARQCPGGVCDRRFNVEDAYTTKYNGRFSMVKWKWLKDSDIPISHHCCNIMKKKPAKKFEKETGLKPIIGTMASESSLRKQKWIQNGCNIFDGKRDKSAPMSFWTEQDVLQYIYEYGIDISPIYGEVVKENDSYRATGYDRTGCMYCAFGCHLQKAPNKFQMLKKTHPSVWNFCMKPTDKGGLGMKDVLGFINVETGWDDDEDYSDFKTCLHTKDEITKIFDETREEYKS